MEPYISKAAVVAEIKKRKKEAESNCGGYKSYDEHRCNACMVDFYEEFLEILDTIEVKEVEECKQPKYSCFETTYQCGKKPRWNIGDTLAYYEFCSDREGEYVLGKVTEVYFDKEQCDWFYTLEDGKVYDEQTLLEEETYKKN